MSRNKEFMSVGEEIAHGGIGGICGLDQIDWGGKGGAIYEVWKCDPCCGTPKDGFLCCFSWLFLPCCTMAKLFSSTVEQPCSVIPHCTAACLVPCCLTTVVRYNIRKKAAIKGNIIGDCFCGCCCGCCSLCQELRAVSPSYWNWIDPCSPVACVAPNPEKLII
eukprot:Tbor_TRINITY_DN5222_c0_g13::TRINITY_DN5222_c0_g13_i1::g.16382::m.16382